MSSNPDWVSNKLLLHVTEASAQRSSLADWVKKQMLQNIKRLEDEIVLRLRGETDYPPVNDRPEGPDNDDVVPQAPENGADFPIPTEGNLRRHALQALSPVTQPVEQNAAWAVPPPNDQAEPAARQRTAVLGPLAGVLDPISAHYGAQAPFQQQRDQQPYPPYPGVGARPTIPGARHISSEPMAQRGRKIQREMNYDEDVGDGRRRKISGDWWDPIVIEQ